MRRSIYLPALVALAAAACTGAAPSQPDAREHHEAPAALDSGALEAPTAPAAYTSPAWQVPVAVPAGTEILDYGIFEYDNRARDLAIRLVAAGAFGPKVIHGPVSVTAPVGEADISAGMQASIPAPDRPLLIQVWRVDIAQINQGRLIGVWLETSEGRLHFSAIGGRGAGTVGYMLPGVDWIEP